MESVENYGAELEKRKKEVWRFLNATSSKEEINLSPEDIKNIYGNKGGLRLCAYCDNPNNKVQDVQYAHLADIVKVSYQKLKVSSTVLLTYNDTIKKQLPNFAKDSENLSSKIEEISKKYPGLNETIAKLQSKIEKIQKNTAEDLLDFTNTWGTDLLAVGLAIGGLLEAIKKGKLYVNKKDLNELEYSDASREQLKSFTLACKNFLKTYDLKDINIYENNRKEYRQHRFKCGEEAVKYLNNSKLVKNMSKNLKNIKKSNEEKKLIALKILFACQIAVCSSETSHRKAGIDMFTKISSKVLPYIK